MQFSLAAEISRQKSTESGRSAISVRSPVSVCGAQASTAGRAVSPRAGGSCRPCRTTRAQQAEVVAAALHHRHRDLAPERLRRGSGCPCGRAAPAGSWCRWRSPPGGPAPSRAAGTRGSCRCPCPPRPGAARRLAVTARPPPRRAAAGTAAPRSRAARAARQAALAEEAAVSGTGLTRPSVSRCAIALSRTATTGQSKARESPGCGDVRRGPAPGRRRRDARRRAGSASQSFRDVALHLGERGLVLDALERRRDEAAHLLHLRLPSSRGW